MAAKTSPAVVTHGMIFTSLCHVPEGGDTNLPQPPHDAEENDGRHDSGHNDCGVHGRLLLPYAGECRLERTWPDRYISCPKIYRTKYAIAGTRTYFYPLYKCTFAKQFLLKKSALQICFVLNSLLSSRTCFGISFYCSSEARTLQLIQSKLLTSFEEYFRC